MKKLAVVVWALGIWYAFAGQSTAGAATTPKCGDFNLDGGITQTDLGIWRGKFGALTGLSGDDGDGDADGADFLCWQRSYEGGMQMPAANDVPEPNGFVCLVTAGVGLAFARCALALRRHA